MKISFLVILVGLLIIGSVIFAVAFQVTVNDSQNNLEYSVKGNKEIKKDSTSTNKIIEYSDLLYEINNKGLDYKNNKNSEKFNKQMNLMQEKQKEIASEILGIEISDAYVEEGWNFPFMNSLDIEPIPGQELIPICNVPENIPTHLEIIKDSEMFQMFVKKYSKYPITIDISDERRYISMIHYSIIATSEDENYHASTYFHIDSCTGKLDPYLNLHCRGPSEVDFNHAYLLENIKDSLEDDSFCTISFKPWQEKLFEYSERRSAESENVQQYLHAKTESEELDDISEIFSELKRLELLGRISFEATRNMEDINTWKTGDVLEYKEKYGELPDELLRLIEQR